MANNKPAPKLVAPPPPTAMMPDMYAANSQKYLAQGGALPALPQQAETANPFDAMFEAAPQTAAAVQPTPEQGNPFDAMFDQAPQAVTPAQQPGWPAPPTQAPGQAQPMPGQAPPAAAKKVPPKLELQTVTRKNPTPKVVVPKVAPPPNAFDQAGQAIQKGFMDTARNAYHGLPGIPLVGPMLAGMAGTAKQAGADYQKNPMEAAAATVAGAPAGVIGFGQDVASIASRLSDGWIPQPPDIKQQYLDLPAVKPFTSKYKGATGVGEFVGGMAIPIPGAKLATAGLKGLTKAAVRGSLAGGAFGAIGNAGEQARKGPIDAGKVIMEGALPGAAIGIAADAGMHAVGAHAKKMQANKEVSGHVVEPGDMVQLKDGSSLTVQEATALIDDPKVPEAHKTEILDQLRARDERIVNGQAHPEAKTTFESRIVNGKKVEVKGDQAEQLRKVEETYKADRQAISDQYADAPAIKKKELAKLEATYQNDLTRLTKPAAAPAAPKQPKVGSLVKTPDGWEQVQGPPNPGEMPAPKVGSITKPVSTPTPIANEPFRMVKDADGNWTRTTEPAPPKDTRLKVTYQPGENGPSKVVEPVRDHFIKPNEEPHPEYAAKQERYDYEQKHFPLSGELFGDAARNGKWRPRDLSPSQIESSIDYLNRMEKHRGGNLTTVQQRQMKGLQQEKMRRAQREQLGLEQDHPSDDIESDVTTQEAQPEPQAVEPRKSEPPNPEAEKVAPPAVAPEAKPAEDLKAVPEDRLHEIIASGAEHEQAAAVDELVNRYKAPETPPAELTADTPAPPEAPQHPEGFFAAKRADGKGYQVFKPDGSPHNNRKLSQAEAARLASGLNDGTVNQAQGRGEVTKVEPVKSQYREDINAAGQSLPDAAPAGLKEKLNAVAEAKHAYDEARAAAEAADLAARELGKQGPPRLTLKRKPVYTPEHEQAIVDANRTSPDLGLEVNSSKKLQGKHIFKPGTTPAEAFAKALELKKAEAAAKKAFEEARAKTVSEADAYMRQSENPSSINIPHAKGDINIRLRPKQGTGLNQSLIDKQGNVGTSESFSYSRKELEGFHSDAKAAEAAYNDGATSTSPRAKAGSRSQSGAFTLAIGGGKPKAKAAAPANPDTPALASMAKGAEKSSSIKELVNDAEPWSRVLNLRRTMDFVKEQNPQLHNQVWEGIAKETIQARGVKFKPEHQALVEKSLSMEADAIRRGADGLNKLDAAQRNYLATRKAIRSQSAKLVRDELVALTKQYQGKQIPNSVEHRVKVLSQLEKGLSGRDGGTGDAGDFAAGKMMANALYDYVFKWNTAYHALNLLDPVVVGSARLGPMRVMKAKALIQMDPKVKSFLKGHDAKGPMQQLREEASGSANKDTSNSLYAKAKRSIAHLQNLAPDLPSESWNFEDTLAASIIAHGDKIKYRGGGTQLLQDMAHGKVDMQTQVKAYTEALQAVQDVTGSGSMGLDKDPIQRSPAMKYVVQFASQPYRVARLMKDWAAEKNYGAIGTFAVINTLVAGSSTIPRTVMSALQSGPPEMKAFAATLEDFADNMNVYKKLTGRDLVDKMRWDLVPALGGTQANMIIDLLDSRLREINGQKWDKLQMSMALFTLSGILGGGGLQIDKMQRAGSNAAKGEKAVYAISDNLTKGSGKMLGSTTVPYNAGAAIQDAFLPGKANNEQAYIKSMRRAAVNK